MIIDIALFLTTSDVEGQWEVDKEELYWDICKKIEPDNTNKILLDDNTKKIWIVWKGK
ncbi:hypothetical protein SAMN02910289_00148 [Lachnospiraceae bacterium RM5]|nr:hypothetical protein SAMN02910289_00148 [Lachnospiraceae bacterium RM5]